MPECAIPHADGPGYAELHCVSSFSFQRGASQPEELVERAAALGYGALAITDECSVAGAVRAHQAAKRHGLHLLLGSEFRFNGFAMLVLARNLEGWGNLCECITAARRGAGKGGYSTQAAQAQFARLGHCELLLVPSRSDTPDLIAINAYVSSARALFSLKFSLVAELLLAPDDAWWLATLQQVAAEQGLPLVAGGDVHMHVRSRKPLQDVMTAVRLGCSVARCGHALQPNAERHLRSRERLARLYPPALLQGTLEVAARCTFSLDEIRYHYPLESVPAGMSPTEALAWFTWEGAAGRYPQGVPEPVRRQLEHELSLVAECRYEMYFLTVYDIVRYARSQGILCQGRGSAANSAVCFCLGITAVDPAKSSLLFERFISRERGDPPDIDVDFEHQRREEVIQYIYTKYGRERAAITAVVTTYRMRSVLRDVGKALDVPAPLIDAFAREHHWFDEEFAAERLMGLAQQCAQETGAPPITLRTARLWIELSAQLLGFPRHLSQHVGGFVLTQGKLTRLVPVENAAMAERSIIQWDKDDIDAVGLMKVDILALGMLTALRRALDLRALVRGQRWDMADIPQEDPATYAMACAADTVGVFQIESRAPMSMLPRLQPRTFYDLVVQVAIVRPGPIQGGMVHPYLRAREHQRRGQRRTVEYPALEPALGRTLGVPIFQEQVMQIAITAGGFSPGQADNLRRSMGAWKRRGGVHEFERPLVDGMVARGYRKDFADAIFQQLLGFGEYGFPESHAYSFALLAYCSSWLKCHEPACFLAALLNSQPMGFYGPSQLVQDARRHGVRVLPIDVLRSAWECTLEDLPDPHMPGPEAARPQGPGPSDRARLAQPAVRLGLCMVDQLPREVGQRLVQARADQAFESVEDLAARARLTAAHLQLLAFADALAPLSGHRRQQIWEAAAHHPAPPLMRGVPVHEQALALPAPAEGEEVVSDYAATGLTLRRHPLALLRPRLSRAGLRSALQLRAVADGSTVRACGIVTVRQRPGSAEGTMFVSLEDETGPVNVIVWPVLVEECREVLLRSRLLGVEGVWQCHPQAPGVRHLVARSFRDFTPWLGRMAGALQRSRDFH